MLDFIYGRVERTTDKEIVINCNGIGYLLSCSYNTLVHLNDKTAEVKVYTYLAVKENGIELYGFYTMEEREMFLRLIDVSKVGPKVALSILSMYTPNEVAKIISLGDHKSLSKAPGVGKKLAESIVFNLKDKFADIDDIDYIVDESDLLVGAGVKDESLMGLMSLGFDRSFAIKLINEVYNDTMKVEEVIAAVLKSVGN